MTRLLCTWSSHYLQKYSVQGNVFMIETKITFLLWIDSKHVVHNKYMKINIISSFRCIFCFYVSLWRTNLHVRKDEQHLCDVRESIQCKLSRELSRQFCEFIEMLYNFLACDFFRKQLKCRKMFFPISSKSHLNKKNILCCLSLRSSISSSGGGGERISSLMPAKLKNLEVNFCLKSR